MPLVIDITYNFIDSQSKPMTIIVFALAVKYTSLIAFPWIKYSENNTGWTNPNIYVHATFITHFLADPGKTRGCSTNTVGIRWVNLFLLSFYGAMELYNSFLDATL